MDVAKGVVVMKGVMARVAWWKRGGVLVRDKGEGGPKRVTVVTERALKKKIVGYGTAWKGVKGDCGGL